MPPLEPNRRPATAPITPSKPAGGQPEPAQGAAGAAPSPATAPAHGAALPAARTSAMALGTAPAPPAADDGKTWGGPGSTRELNFGHREDAQGQLYKLDPSGVPVWAGNGKAITGDQWANMPKFQQEAILALVPGTSRAAFEIRMAEGDAARARRSPPPPDVPGATGPHAPTSEAGRAQLAELLRAAQADSRGQRPDGHCYEHVWNYIAKTGFGKFPAVGIPDSHARYARQFAELVDQDPARFGLKRLPIDNPYDAPPGAIVVVAPGTPGTRHRTAGDIAVASGRGDFYNGGEMGYGGRGNFPPGNRHLLGIYVPA